MSDILRPAKRMLMAVALLMVGATPCLAGTQLQLHTLEQIATTKPLPLVIRMMRFLFHGRTATALRVTLSISATVSSARSRQNFSLKAECKVGKSQFSIAVCTD